ncbi:MAG: VWA domain-containing protein [Terriglobia bacterium]
MFTPTRYSRVRVVLACGVTLAACALWAHAQSPGAPPASNTTVSQASGRVLNVAAIDEKGQPVTDLTSADFKVFDDGKVQPIVNFNSIPVQPTGNTQPPTTLVLFDLLNSLPSQRDYFSTLIIRALEPQARGDLVYLYLLTNHGDLYPVRALSMPQPTAVPPQGARGPAEPPWTRQVLPLLDQAIQKVYGIKPMEYWDQGERTAVTFRALGELGDQFMRIPGPKSIVWITQGVSNWVGYPYGCKDIIFPEESGSYVAGKCEWSRGPAAAKCLDYTPFLQHFGAKLTRSDTLFYAVEANAAGVVPHDVRGWPRDTLQELVDLSGGRLYLNAEIDKAIAQSLQVVRARYQLTYVAPPPDGKYHKLRVECSRQGVRIVAPHEYRAV